MTDFGDGQNATEALLETVARLRGRLRILVVVVCVAIVMLAPGVTAFFKLREVNTLAQNSAMAVAESISRLISQFPTTWFLMAERVDALLGQRAMLADAVSLRAETLDGKIVAQQGKQIGGAAIVIVESITDGFVPVGRLVLTVDPVRPLIWIVAAALGGLTVAISLFLALRAAPFSIAESALLRLARTRQDLEAQLHAANAARDRARASEIEMRDAQDRANQAELRLHNAINALADGFRLWDANDRLILCNRAFHGMSMVATAKRIGSTFEEEIREAAHANVIKGLPDDRERFVRQRLEQRRRSDGTPMIHQRIDGRWYEIREHRTEEGGVVQVRTDITQRMQHEAELQAARDTAEKASRAKSEFLSLMSHDLRTPLNAILGFAQVLMIEDGEEALSSQQRNAVETIERTGRHLLGMVEDILDLSRIENHAVVLTPERINVGDIVRESLTVISAMISSHGAKIMVDPALAGLANVVGDYRRVMQVTNNLLTNALKYGSAGGAIKLTARAENGLVRIEIRDHGPGISPARQAQIFEPFNRAGADGLATEGTGLGLAIAKGLVERMGGSIGCESAPGEGATFWFTLPQAPATAEWSAPDASTPPKASDTARLRELGTATVLYIEDTIENRMLVKRLLGRYANIRYLEAENAESGIDIARRELPDVVLMDMRMPGMGGVEALRILRADPRTQHIPVIALTGAAMPHEAVEITKAGFEGYITKPFRISDLLTQLTEVIERRIRKAAV